MIEGLFEFLLSLGESIRLVYSDRESKLDFAFLWRHIWSTKWNRDLSEADSAMAGWVLLWSVPGPREGLEPPREETTAGREGGRGNCEHLPLVLKWGQRAQLDRAAWICWHIILSSSHVECCVPKFYPWSTRRCAETMLLRKWVIMFKVSVITILKMINDIQF